MKRLMAVILLSVSLTLGVIGTVPSATAADRVRCDFRGSYRITCTNSTPYRVHVRLKLFTECGVRYRYFTILNYSHTIYNNCYINRISWRWNY